MLEAREQYFTMSCKFCLIVILKRGESVCKIFSHFSPSSDLDNCKDFAQILSGVVIMNQPAGQTAWLINEYEFWEEKVLMMGGLWSVWWWCNEMSACVRCVRCLQGVSAGVRVIEAEELSRRLGERDRAGQSHKVPRQTPLDTELTRLFIALPGRGKSYGLTHSKH